MFNSRWLSYGWIYVGIMAAGLISGCGGTAPVARQTADADIVARFAGRQLSLTEFENRYARSVGGRGAALDDSLAEYKDFLNRYVDFRLKVEQAKAAGLDRDPDILQEIEQYKSQLARPYLVDQEIVDGLVQDLFDRQQEEVSASHILVRIPGEGLPSDTLAAYQKMVTLRDSVLAGALFNEIAARNSEDPSAPRNSGNLGTFTGGRMIKAFEDQAYQTPVGAMSPIFRTRFGYHVLQVHSRGKRSADIRAAHILIRTADDDTVEAIATIREIMDKIGAGEDFAALATEYSEDQGSAASGGDLGFFGRGRMVAPFEDAAFDLKEIGEVSPPVRTRFGYHLIKLLEVAKLPAYDEAYDELKTLVQRLPRFAEAEEALARRYRVDLGGAIDTTALKMLTSGFSPDSTLFALAIEKWSDDQKATVLATMGGREFSLGDFLDYGNEKRSTPSGDIGFEGTLATLDRMLDDRSLEVAAEHLEDNDPDFKDLMNEYRDGIVLFKIMEDSVWNRASTDSVGLMTIYEAEAPSYRFDERKRVVSFYSKSDSVLAMIAASWTPGDTTDWAGRVQEEGFRIDTTFVSDSTNSIYDQALSLAPGETSSPIRYRRGFILFALDGIEAPRQKMFKEARADIVTKYQEQLEDEWLARLREKFGAVLYPGNLVHAFSGSDSDAMNSGR